MKRLITNSAVVAVHIRAGRYTTAARTSILETDEWIEAFDNGQVHMSHDHRASFYATPAGWINANAVTLLEHDDNPPSRVTRHHRGTPDPTKGTPTVTKETFETTLHDTEAILTIRNKVTGEVELFHVETGIVTEQTGGKPNHVLTIASEGWKTHALHGKDLAAKTWDIAKNLWATPTPDTTADTNQETPPPAFPKYVMYNEGGWAAGPAASSKLLRHHDLPDHAGEYLEYAAGPYTRIRQLLEDLEG